MTVYLIFWRDRRGTLRRTIVDKREHYEWALQILRQSDTLELVGDFEVNVP